MVIKRQQRERQEAKPQDWWRVQKLSQMVLGSGSWTWGSCEGEMQRMLSAWASFCFWNKTGLNRLGVQTSQQLDDRAINDAQEVLLNKDCLYKEGPLMIIGLVKK